MARRGLQRGYVRPPAAVICVVSPGCNRLVPTTPAMAYYNHRRTDGNDRPARATRTGRLRTGLSRAIALSVALAGLVLLSVGCSSGQSPAAATSSSPTPTGGQTYAACMRSHGVANFPDSGPPEGVDLSSPQFQSAQQACRSLQPGGSTTQGNGALSPQQREHLLKFAICMRSHGVPNFPDPSSQGLSPDGVDIHSPQFQSAQEACKSLLPNNGSGSGKTTQGQGSSNGGGL